MSLKSVVSKLLYYSLAAFEVAHGGFNLFGYSELETRVFGGKTLGYLSKDESGTMFTEYVVRSAGLAQLVLGLTIFMLGDTKLGFMAMLIPHIALVLTFDRDTKLMRDSGDLSALHAEGIEMGDLANKVVLALNFVGLMFAGSKREGLRRTSSRIASLILYTMITIESTVTFFALMGSEYFFERMAPGADANTPGFSVTKVLTPLGLQFLQLIHTIYNVQVLTANALLHTLKPTSVALLLTFIFHVGIGAVDFYIHMGLENVSGSDESTILALRDMFNTGVVFHGVCAGALLFGAVLAGLSAPAPAKAKKD
mmetsp:Transcript_21302/g.41767  ORF Transcript_21302/g.41767 Transcript_21302/m.41767 type:complete len:311 (+) Transcript_21302:95-1027(+)